MKRFATDLSNLESRMRKKAALDLKSQLKSDVMTKNSREKTARAAPFSPGSLPSDMVHLGGENFATVNYFLGHTRVHVRKYIHDEDGELCPTKDGVSLSPKVWHSLCSEINSILNHRSCDKVFVIDRDLSVSKQLKDGMQFFVFQRMFQRSNLTMHFVPECIVLKELELAKLCESVCLITDHVKDGLITYSLPYYIEKELKSSSLQLNTVDNPDAFLELLQSLRKCLLDAISLKISELFPCFGCRESYQVDFMHDCLTKSRSEKFSDWFEKALYSINMNDLAKDLVQQNLNIDFDTVLGAEEFFDAIIVKELFNSVQKMYIGDEKEQLSNDLVISCNE